MATAIETYASNGSNAATLYSGSLTTSSATVFTTSGISSSYYLDSVMVPLFKTGAPTGNATVTFYSTTGTVGTNAVPNALLATSSSFDVSTLTGSAQNVTFTFSGANRINLANATGYACAVNYSGGNSSNYVTAVATNVVASTNYAYKSTGSWTSSTNLLQAMTIYALSETTPVANFTGSPTTLNLGDVVQFTDTSANQPLSWSWNFGDSNTSTIQNPGHVYGATGTYTVTLTASNDAGSNTKTQSNYITVVNPAQMKGISSISGISSITG